MSAVERLGRCRLTEAGLNELRERVDGGLLIGTIRGKAYLVTGRDAGREKQERRLGIHRALAARQVLDSHLRREARGGGAEEAGRTRVQAARILDRQLNGLHLRSLRRLAAAGGGRKGNSA